MKKLISTIVIITLMFSTVSFASPTTDAINDLTIVSNDLRVTYETMFSQRPYNKNDLKKQLTFDKTIANSTIDTMQSSQNRTEDLSLKKEYSTIIVIASLYVLAINNLLLYLENTNNLEYVLDSVNNFRIGDFRLKQLSSTIK